jgi:hypothetical protein
MINRFSKKVVEKTGQATLTHGSFPKWDEK